MLKKSFFRFVDSLDLTNKLSNKAVLNFFEIMHIKISKRKSKANAIINTKNIDKLLLKDGYIENQSWWKRISYGSSTMDYSGCEIIAVYNALFNLNKEQSCNNIVELISYFEKHGSALRGFFGTSPRAIERYFAKKGYDTAISLDGTAKSIEAIENRYETFIVTFFNDVNRLSSGVHTVCITGKRNGYYIHNNYKIDSKTGFYTSQGPFDTLENSIRLIKPNSKMISLIGIK